MDSVNNRELETGNTKLLGYDTRRYGPHIHVTPSKPAYVY